MQCNRLKSSCVCGGAGGGGGGGGLHLFVTEVAAVGSCAVEKSSCTARYLNEQLKWSGVQLSVFLFLSL